MDAFSGASGEGCPVNAPPVLPPIVRDLLAALKKALPCLEDYADDFPDDGLPSKQAALEACMRELRAAIAKAEK